MATSVLIQSMQLIGSYIIVILIGFFLINFLSNGFLIKFLIVKISRGKKTLVEVKDVGETYYKAGVISDGVLKYKNKQKDNKILFVTNEDIEYRMGLKTVCTDGVKNTIIRRDGKEVSGFDAKKMDNLLVRALTSPQLQDMAIKILIFLVVIGLILGVANIFFIYSVKSQYGQLISYLNSTRVI